MDHLDHLMGAGQQLDVVLLVGAGLAMSLGHCLGMCGPLVGSLAGAQRERGLSLRGIAGAHLLHHLGRLTSYALIGFVFALVGTTVRLSTTARGVQGGLSLVMGLVMVILALGLLGWLPTRRFIEGGRLALTIHRATGTLRSATGPAAWLLMGMANGFLPCGPVWAVAAGTAATSPLAGAAAMVLFGLGTVPALLLFALGAGRIGPAAQRRFNRLAAVLVLLIGLQLLLRGAAALGWVGHLRFGGIVLW